MRILIFGATGFVGQHLVPHLIERGHDVTVAARSTKAVIDPQAARIEADPSRPGPWQDKVADFDAIINLVGAPIATRWNAAGKKRILESRIASTQNIAKALEKTSGKTFLCANAVGFYGDGQDHVLDEDAPRGQGFLADVAWAWQEEALRVAATHRVLTPRFAVVLGVGGALGKMLPPFSLGLGGRLGHGRQWFSWIHIQDLSRAISFLLETENARGVFNLCAPEAVTNATFTRTLGRVLNRPTILPVPALALRLVMGEAASMLLTGQRCSPARLLAHGFAFNQPRLEGALADIVPRFKST